MSTKLIYVTAPSRKEAERLAETVVTERLAACANILDGVTSIFHWEGNLCRENEAVLFLKTEEDRTEALIARIRQLHSYECPCITVLPVEGGSPDFLQWVKEETAPNR
ncbi:MAG TPA: divalent-cation tolerance protein CutA [Pontiellaceae bacterium]|nr:divalent-cation tolerance protein CutA [Pontiellaceae bacterium]HPR83232.1 divalent-cation tolerance protein CutA [Pontiellaceae bacterium]